ncbi:hypothetical protein [Motiliproteus sp. MSK22-1]|uniref:hypothetical protein n=1 Tax=Motiliproteus sp. MSK22-1 TaxID=1897630 RepID=UPI000975B78F|nr:hypothetical protein [Motiliproteus sp. MSK22-1]OMH36156.1 hypothetical protein BGP75_10420 [Motiliproteus sp. MSK22-1]
MKLYVQIDHTDGIDALPKTDISSAINAWLESSTSNASHAQQESSPSQQISERLGIHIEVQKRMELKEPLNFLYSLARQHKTEFVIGIIDEKTGNQEDVCYFGFEEGKPDIYEISNYLGL